MGRVGTSRAIRHLSRARTRGQAAAFDEDGRERRADQAAADDAGHGGSHGNGRGALDAGLLEERRERQAGRGTARQRDGTR